jgi:hypothetical protein
MGEQENRKLWFPKDKTLRVASGGFLFLGNARSPVLLFPYFLV